MVKENQVVTSQLGDVVRRADENRKDGDAAHASISILQQTVKARELELADFRAAYEGLAAEARASEAAIEQMKRQLAGCGTELEGARAEITHLRDASHSSQLQIQQYVVDVQALERNSDALARELQAAKAEAEDLARDRNRVLEQMQAVQVQCMTQHARSASGASLWAGSCRLVREHSARSHILHRSIVYAQLRISGQ
jgi:chromosome segregation ATPase